MARQTALAWESSAAMHPENLPFRVIPINSEDEVIARTNNLIVGRAAQETTVRPRMRSSTAVG